MTETVEKQARTLCIQAENCLSRARCLPEQVSLVREALGYYQQAVELEANLPDPWLGLALMIFSAGQKDRALGILKAAQQAFPIERRLIQLELRLQRAHVPEQGEMRPIAKISSLRSLLQVEKEEFEGWEYEDIEDVDDNSEEEESNNFDFDQDF